MQNAGPHLMLRASMTGMGYKQNRTNAGLTLEERVPIMFIDFLRYLQTRRQSAVPKFSLGKAGLEALGVGRGGVRWW